jgi:hypothetical protein
MSYETCEGQSFLKIFFFSFINYNLLIHTPQKNPIVQIGSKVVHKQIKCKPNLKGTSQPKFENK